MWKKTANLTRIADVTSLFVTKVWNVSSLMFTLQLPLARLVPVQASEGWWAITQMACKCGSRISARGSWLQRPRVADIATWVICGCGLSGPGSFWVFNAQKCISTHSRDSFLLFLMFSWTLKIDKNSTLYFNQFKIFLCFCTLCKFVF